MDPAKAAILRQNLKEQKKAKRLAAREEARQAREEAVFVKAQVDAVNARETEEYIESRRRALQLQQNWKAQAALKSERPEWDLNDPKLRNGVAVDLENCGFAAAQRFAGESSNHVERLSMQEAEMEAFERRRAAEDAKLAAAAAAEQLAMATEYASRMANEEFVARRREEYRIQQENKAIARQKRDRIRQDKAEDDELAKLEIQVTMANLHEGKQSQFRYDNPNRIKRDAFKGLSDQQRAAIIEENKRMIAKNEEHRKWEAAEELRATSVMMEANQQATEQLRQNYLEGKREELQIAQENQLLKKQARHAEAERNKSAKSNAVGDAFFNGFGNHKR